MNNREPSWWHMLWIIPSVIVTETPMVLGIIWNDKEGIMEDDEKAYSGLIDED